MEGEIYRFCVGLIRFNDSVVRDTMISRGEQPLDEHSNFYLLRHDEGPNMHRPVIERDAWVMLLGFPLNYQTEHYIIKAVSCFGRCMYWHRPGHRKSRLLVRVLINELDLVPFSLVVKRFTDISGLGTSWTVPVYVLNGRNPSQGLVGDEEAPPPLGASPHPEHLPFLNAMQQQQHEAQVWQL